MSELEIQKREKLGEIISLLEDSLERFASNSLGDSPSERRAGLTNIFDAAIAHTKSSFTKCRRRRENRPAMAVSAPATV